MIDIALEKPISLSDLPPEAIPGRNGKPVHYVTLSLWYRRGVRGVKLETILIGNRRCTSIEALSRFYQAVSLAPDTHPRGRPACTPLAPALPRTPEQKAKAVRKAVKYLADKGV